MIQGKFYQRLHFYMDSCAISPMASLLVSVIRVGNSNPMDLFTAITAREENERKKEYKLIFC